MIHGAPIAREPESAEKRAAVQRTPQVPCKLCPAARHLLHACRRATPAAKDAAYKVLEYLRQQEAQRQAEQMRAGGVPEDRIEAALLRLGQSEVDR